MRRSLLALLLLPLITACARTNDVSPEIVMERTVQANRNLRSAHAEGTMRFRQMPIFSLPIDEGTIRYEGDLQDAGRQLALTVQITGNHVEGNGRTVDATVDLIVLDGSEVYVRMEEMDSDGEMHADDPVQRLSSILAGAWWSMTPPSSSDDTFFTPDPMLLRMQSEAVRIVRDNGIKRMNGRDVHVFDVQMDAHKLRALLTEGSSSGSGLQETLSVPDADGSLWIDTQTYFLHRARWTVRFEDEGSMDLNVVFSDHQKPVTIAPPRDALPLPSNAHDFLMIPMGRQYLGEPAIILTD